MKPIIDNCTTKDLDFIFKLYHIATNFQKSKGTTVWPEFKRSTVLKDIAENRQWKLIIDNKIACIWTITFNDPLIWQEKNNDPSIYIHRIATNPKFRGKKLVNQIVTWSKDYAKIQNKSFVRMDTVGKNIGLINHYKKCGFDF